LTSLAELSCTDLLSSYEAGESSPVDAVQACLDRIEAVDDRLKAVMTICPESALDQARYSERRWHSGQPLPLDGIPFGLKDIINTAGIRTTGGSLVYKHMVPDVNATVADRLLGAGGILLGKLQTWEFATDGVPFANTRNPWNLDCLAGGSSSGSAAAVAAREMPLAVGTDTGGSIRVPSAFCGVTSIKPTFGRVPRFGVMPISWTLDHVGPMARTAEDLALALEVMAGHDARDPSSSNLAVPSYRSALSQDLRGVCIGVPENWFFDLCDSAIERATRAAIDVVRSCGATITPIIVPHLGEVDPVALLWLTANPESAVLHEVNFEHLDLYSVDNVNHFLDGRLVLAIDYMRALRLRSVLQSGFEEAMERLDAIIVPGTCSVAPRRERDDSIVEAWAVVGGQRFPWLQVVGRTTSVFNLTGMPAVMLPSGLNQDGLPMAIQVASRPHSDGMCLRIAHCYQQSTRHHLAAAPLATARAGAVGVESKTGGQAQ
jgi:aspartyl-tRNA(Asn)/glutamyl-tRNA(Gln) amidotransferase subunit A